MKRLDRLGSVAFLTITISLVFHLLGISFNHWKVITCQTCQGLTPLESWTTSIRQRCYDSSVASIFFNTIELNSSIVSKPFVTNFCLPNQYITAKGQQNVDYCLNISMSRPDTACSLRTFDPNRCQCDYTSSTKAVLATAVLSSISLGILMFLTHFVAFVKIDYILRWLLPISLALLIFSIIFIITTLSIVGRALDEDIRELRYAATLVSQGYANDTDIEYWQQYLHNETRFNYATKAGWCFGMEILSLYFAVVSLVIYGLIILAKKRSSPKKY